jgi:F-type H+-transporting ATPase subunit gamma
MSGATDVLSRQISSAKDLSTVVRSMKALAASSLGQYEKAVESLNGYYHAIELGLSQCLRQIAPARDDPPAQQKRSTTIGAVVFGSDQGLVGRFNEVLMEFTVRELEKLPGKVTRTWAVGDRMQALVADSGLPGGVVPAAQPLSVPNSVEAVTPMVGRILMDIQAATERGEVVEVYLFYNRSMSSAAYEPVVKRLLPLDAAWRNHLLGLPWPTKSRPSGNTCSCCCSRPAPNLSPAKMALAWQPCSAPKRIFATFSSSSPRRIIAFVRSRSTRNSSKSSPAARRCGCSLYRVEDTDEYRFQ